MVYISRKTEVSVTASLISRNHQLPIINLELYQTETWSLITLCIRGA